MLAGVVLVRLGDPHRRVAGLQERHLVAAAAEAVGAVDHAHIEVGQVLVGEAVDGARQVARGRVHLAAVVAAIVGLRRGLVGLGAFGEHPHRGVADHAVLAVAVADDVIVELGLDLPAMRHRVVGQHLAAVQALFLAGQRREHQGGAVVPCRQQSCCLDQSGHAGGVVVGAGCVAGAVHHVADARVQMAGDHDDALRVGAAALDRHHVHHLRRRGCAFAGEHLRGRDDFDAAAAVLRDRLETRLHPAPGGTDAAAVGCRVGQRVAGAEADQAGDRHAQFDLAGRIGQGVQRRLFARHRRQSGRGGDRQGGKQEQGGRQHEPEHRDSSAAKSRPYNLGPPTGGRKKSLPVAGQAEALPGPPSKAAHPCAAGLTGCSCRSG
ncbi:hypothetical protein RLIN73S_02445 [Rhodanobacter lindaniclasticus]